MIVTQEHDNIAAALTLLDADREDDRWIYYRRSNLLDPITSQLLTGGGTYDPHEYQEVLSYAVTHVIDCRIESRSHKGWRRYGAHVNYLWTGFDDDFRPKGSSVWAKGIAFGVQALSEGGIVYAHCAAGMNRGPSMAYALLRAHYRLKPAAAFAAIQAVRPCAGVVYAADVERALIDLGYERS